MSMKLSSKNMNNNKNLKSNLIKIGNQKNGHHIKIEKAKYKKIHDMDQNNSNIVINKSCNNEVKINNKHMKIKLDKNNCFKTSSSDKSLIKHNNENNYSSTSNNNSVRLNKAMSMLGICSRRDADKYISNKSVYINNILVANLGSKVNDRDIITVNGIKYTFTNKQKTRVWLYNKPSGLVTTHKDEKNRETVFDNIIDIIGQRVISVGRLDLNSEGLLLLTNDGSFARYAESPSTGGERHYRVRFFGNINDDIIKQISNGITINGIKYSPIKIINISDKKGLNKWCTCILKEGKNREIRKIFNHFGLQVNKLIRIKYGPYELGDLKSGEVVEVNDRRKS